MVFNGIYPANALRPASFGLLSVSEVDASETETSWIRGFAFEYDTNPTIKTLSNTGAIAHVNASHSGINRFLYVKPFFIESEDFRSMLGVTAEERDKRVVRQLAAATQKTVEEELWSGYSTRADATGNNFLAKTGTLQFARSVPGTAVTFLLAVSSLEAAMVNSPIGEDYVMHLTKGVASRLSFQQGLMRVDKHLETIIGARVSVGSGNTGDGPVVDVTNAALTGNVVTMTTATNHYLSVGETVGITITTGDAAYNGAYIVASTPTSTTFTYAKTHADVTTGAVVGTTQMLGDLKTQWIYSTGQVNIRLGSIELVNKSAADGTKVDTNDIRFMATRPAAVYFDPSIHYAVKVDVTV